MRDNQGFAWAVLSALALTVYMVMDMLWLDMPGPEVLGKPGVFFLVFLALIVIALPTIRRELRVGRRLSAVGSMTLGGGLLCSLLMTLLLERYGPGMSTGAAEGLWCCFLPAVVFFSVLLQIVDRRSRV